MCVMHDIDFYHYNLYNDSSHFCDIRPRLPILGISWALYASLIQAMEREKIMSRIKDIAHITS